MIDFEPEYCICNCGTNAPSTCSSVVLANGSWQMALGRAGIHECINEVSSGASITSCLSYNFKMRVPAQCTCWQDSGQSHVSITFFQSGSAPFQLQFLHLPYPV
jgi:hypothetical protein